MFVLESGHTIFILFYSIIFFTFRRGKKTDLRSFTKWCPPSCHASLTSGSRKVHLKQLPLHVPVLSPWAKTWTATACTVHDPVPKKLLRKYCSQNANSRFVCQQKALGLPNKIVNWVKKIYVSAFKKCCMVGWIYDIGNSKIFCVITREENILTK